MGLFWFSLPLTLGLLFQVTPAPKLFPIPESMEHEFPGVQLSETNGRRLQMTFGADWKEDFFDAKKLVSERIEMASLSLGKLGSGVILKVNDEILCGTGGCPLYAYIREKDGYRAVAKSFGWAYGVVRTKSDIPDLAFASNGGGGTMTLKLQSYDGQHFVDKACETLIAKEGFPKSPDDWWDPSKVSLRPCENFEPAGQDEPASTPRR